ncbi:axin isoform X3 [Phlebotomus argentipes]|uniref:axin isoform X3 n=1 Tax=Phlebotomus argentipes TaxID=94469 RepID=UPI0028931443|nr:axin isoform X3 [Phlebotomus argentipes]
MSLPSNEKFDGYECSGPRPPVLGGESRPHKMIEGVPGQESSSSPPYSKWARTLSSLLEDSDGVQLFQRYVETEGGIHADRLNFYFACEGLKKQTDPDKIKRLIIAIYRFLRKSPLKIPENVESVVKAARHSQTQLSANIYDQMQKDVERAINESTYLRFLKSEIYLEHVRAMMSAGAPQMPSASSSSGESEQLTRSFTLPTLHEDSELTLSEASVAGGSQMGGGTAADVPMRLTRDALLATEKRRLEIRPSGAFGYRSYTNNCDAFYPVSLQDSEIQSFSSGQTDSDTASMSTAKDGRSYSQRRQTSMENRAIRQKALTNKEVDSLAIIPRTAQHAMSKKHIAMKPEELILALIPKLEAIKKKQDSEELFVKKMQESDASNERALSFQAELRDAIREKLPVEDDSDQAILDQHVQRVWSDTPNRSPGTKSPDPMALRRRGLEINPGFGVTPMMSSADHMSMRHSRSMPEASSSRRSLGNKWPSMYTDSGISSLFSGDLTMKKDQSSRNIPRSIGMDSATMTTSQLEEASRRLQDESKSRSRRYSQHATAPPLSSHPSHHHLKAHDYTIVVFSFCDEEFPYRTKIPGLQPTLKQFKEYLPKKGNFRFFFKTACEDPENPVIQEEIVSDSEILPLFDGKVMGLVKPFE